MSDRPKPFRLLRDTLLHRAGEVVHLLPDQVTEWHVSADPADQQARLDALEASLATLQARVAAIEAAISAPSVPAEAA